MIPTYNEEENIGSLFQEIGRLKADLPEPLEILVVDDRSPDGTASVASDLGRRYGLDVRVHSRSGLRGLGTAIADGIFICDSDLTCVIDADLSHPPALLPTLLRSLNGFDGVVASRYVPGGKITRWPFHRRLVSFVATKIARSALAVACEDPLSGFFMFRTAALRRIRLTGLGNKPLLEILSPGSVDVFEVPYEFRNRVAGKSKLTSRGILEYVLLVVRLWRQKNRGKTELEDDPNAKPAALRNL